MARIVFIIEDRPGDEGIPGTGSVYFELKSDPPLTEDDDPTAAQRVAYVVANAIREFALNEDPEAEA